MRMLTTMTTPKVNINKFKKRTEKQLNKVLSKDNLKQLGTLALKIIRDRSRRGFGIVSGKLQKFPSLSPKYVDQRRRSRLSPFTNPKKSNITFSGRLLAGLRVKNGRPGQVIVEPSGTSRNGVSNKLIAKHLIKKNRVFLDITKKELDQIIKLLRTKFK